MRFPRNVVYQEAERLGAIVTWEDERSAQGVFTIHVVAPRGTHWSDGAVHALRIEGRPTSAKDRDEMFIDALVRMRCGLEECDLNDTACADHAYD